MSFLAKRKFDEMDYPDSPLPSDSDDEEIFDRSQNANEEEIDGENEADADADAEGDADVEADGEAEVIDEEGDEAAAVGNAAPEEAEKMKLMWSTLNNAQSDRFEKYRRSAFQKAQVKKLMQSVTGSNVNLHMQVAMAGLAKMFVGDIVETARLLMVERGETGPIRPSYIRQAHRRLKAEGKIPQRVKPRLF